MSNVSAFYTPSAVTTPPAAGAAGTPGLAMNQSALGGVGSFLDVLFSALQTNGAPQGEMAIQSEKTLAGEKNEDQALSSIGMITADSPQIPTLSPDALKALQSQLLLLAQDDGGASIDGPSADLSALSSLQKTLMGLAKAHPDETALVAPDTALLMAKIQELAANQTTGGTGTNTLFTQLAAMQLSSPKMDITPTAPGAVTPVLTQEEISSLSDADIAARLNAINVGGDGTTPSSTAEGSQKGGLPQWLSQILAGQGMDAGYVPAPTASSGSYQGTHLPTGDKVKIMMDTILGFFGITPSSDPADLGPAIQIDQTSITPDTVRGFTPHLLNSAATTILSAPSAQGTNLTHAVALQLQNMANNRETRSLTIQINPPELGKMQVKMTYSRDRSIKADIAVEKQDTLSLLQKDSATLRDAMQQAGLQTDAGSLNFTLADQGAFSDHLHDQTGEAGRTASNDNQDVVAEISIRSSEEWSVDPKTGITRYNIYV